MGCGYTTEKSKSAPLKIANVSTKTEPKSIEVKIVLLGNTGVGKSSIAMRFSQDKFLESHEVTIGGAYFQHQITLPNGVSVKMHIWDTGGAERFRSMAHIYYKDAAVAILTYDITQAKSLDGVKYWMDDLERHADRSKMVLALAANKCDKPPEDDYVIPLGRKYAEENNMLFKETSALQGKGIQELFKEISEKVVECNMKSSSNN